MRGMLWEIAGATACLGACSMAWAVRGRSSSIFGKSVYRGAPDRASIALTFDDGPSESTPQLLEVLQRFHVPATFFWCGANVRRLPEVAREVVKAGHQIGNHADSHNRLYLRSASFVKDEVWRAQRTIAETTGVTPVLFRAPFGVRWFGMREIQRQLGLLGVMWTCNGLDWKLPADPILRRLLKHARNGAIFCLHDGRQTQARPDVQPTVEAVGRLIPELSARGFRFETVSQILCPTS
jgi:peptidoglycan/xylan/chitin deacetylase (PgdA/CDA1 family)